MDYEDLKRMVEVAGYSTHGGARAAVDAASCSQNKHWKGSFAQFLRSSMIASDCEENPFAPGPDDDEVGTGEIELGRIVRGRDLGGPFRIPLALLGEHQLWAGHSGSGKSFGIMAQLRQLIGRISVWIFDTEDEYKNLARLFSADELLLLDYKDLRRNLFQPPPNFSTAEWHGRIKNIWRESFFMRDGSVNLLGELLHELGSNPDSLPTLNEFHQKLVSLKFRVNSRTAGYWETLLNRTQALLNFMGQTYSCQRGHDVEYLLGRSVVFRLRGLSDDLFCFFVNDLLSYVMASRETLLGSEPRNLFVFDESHRLFNVARTDRADLGDATGMDDDREGRALGGAQVALAHEVDEDVLERALAGVEVLERNAEISHTPKQRRNARSFRFPVEHIDEVVAVVRAGAEADLPTVHRDDLAVDRHRHAGVAVAVDFAAVERRALGLVAEQVIRARHFRETLGGLGVFLVGIGVELFGELAIGRLDLRLARAARHAQYGIRVVCHAALARETWRRRQAG